MLQPDKTSGCEYPGAAIRCGSAILGTDADEMGAGARCAAGLGRTRCSGGVAAMRSSNNIATVTSVNMQGMGR